MLSCWARLGRTKCDIRVKFRLNISLHRHHVMSRQQCGTKIGPRSLPGIDQITFIIIFIDFCVKFRNICYWCAGLVGDESLHTSLLSTALLSLPAFSPEFLELGYTGTQGFYGAKIIIHFSIRLIFTRICVVG